MTVSHAFVKQIEEKVLAENDKRINEWKDGWRFEVVYCYHNHIFSLKGD
jgi:hypothetical protein